MLRRASIPVTVAVVAALASSAIAAAPTYVVGGASKIGDYAVKRDGSLRGLIAAFGQPTTLRRDARYRLACHASWRPIGLRVSLYNLGGANPCSPEGGRFGQAVMTGGRWRTSIGLRIGDPVRRLRTLYRGERRHGAWWWLVVRRSPFGAGGTYPGLAAKVVRGRVSAFAVSYPAGGD